MVDFAKALADIKAKSRPSLVPSNLGKKRGKDKEPEVIPTLAELVEEPSTCRMLMQQFAEHARLGAQEKMLKTRRLLLTEDLKDACIELGIAKAQAGDTRVSYYSIKRSSIDADKLRALGVSQKIINEATVVTTAWALKTSVERESDDNTEEE